jgi:hypothetical protein
MGYAFRRLRYLNAWEHNAWLHLVTTAAVILLVLSYG